MKSKRGFSMMELLIYVSIFAAVGGLLTGILYNALRVTNQESAGAEVSQQLSLVMGKIQRLVGDSSLIESIYLSDGDLDPTNDPTSVDNDNDCDSTQEYCTLKLRFEDDSSDPTWIVASSTGVYLLQGDTRGGDLDTLATTTLTTSAIVVDYLRFTKYEFGEGHASVRAEIAFTYNTDNEKFQITRALVSAIGRVTAATFDDNILPGGSYSIGSSANPWVSGYFSDSVTIGSHLNIAERDDSPGGTNNYGTLYVASSTNALYYVDEGDVASIIGPAIDTKCVYLEDPVTNEDLLSIWTVNGFSATITKIWCETDAGTAEVNLQVDDGLPADVNSGVITCTTSGVEDTAMEGDDNLTDGDRLDLNIGTVSGATTLSVCWTINHGE